MAKRDTLYTVNRWNKPFFEETRKKLYPLGGDLTNNPIYGLRTGLAGLRWGYGDTGGIDYTAPVSNLTRQNSLNRAVTTFNQYNNPSYYQDIARTNYIYGWDKPLYGGVSDNSSASNPPEYKVESYNPNWLDNVSKITNSITNTAKTAIDAVKTTNTINSQINSLSSAASNTPKFLQGVTAPLSNTLMKSNMDKMASDFGKTLNDLSTLKITDNSGLKHLSLNPNSVTKPGGISNIGKAGVGIGASILGEVGGNLISDGFSTVPGTLINLIGSAAGTVLSMIPGVGWVWGPAVTLGSKLLGGLYNRAFGSEYKDNGATAYTNQLNALNPNGSNEYLANLMASVGLGPQATSRNGWLNHSAERKADRTNAALDLALNRFQRGVRDAFQNNNTRQLWNAYNDYVTYGAMGGRIKRKKCNCKATGGFLNNAMLDSASATGYNFLSDLTNILMQNNLNKQDMGTSLGNSFTGLSNGTLFANGGGININPAHKGEFTAKAKRHGMGVRQFANHVLAHKDKFPSSTVKQAVFAKNANTWKKAFGGKLNYGKDKDNRDSGFFNDPTLYELGGTLQAAGSNWGNVTENSTKGKGYSVGDVIEIDPSEAELLKKLGYEYEVIG